MTVYVFRDGKLVEKRGRNDPVRPYRFQDYESPIDGALITSPRQRERDLNNSGSYDPRDLPKDHQYDRGRGAQRENSADRGRQLDFWR